MKKIHKLSFDDLVNLTYKQKSEWWTRFSRKNNLNLFQRASKQIPAYKDFLKKNHCDPAKINTWMDFQHVPFVSKDNYLRCYPLEALCWNGDLNFSITYTATSGSTGEPFYFPRTAELEHNNAHITKFFLDQANSQASTLVIVAFGMGVWIGGQITYKDYELLAREANLPISIITPGINKKEIFRILKNLAPKYEDVVLAGYPPFVKDILDESVHQGIDYSLFNLRLSFAAEAFPEDFRDYVCRMGQVNNQFLDTVNIYGSADIGAMAWETPLAILIRKLAFNNVELKELIFDDINKTPTFAQFHPYYVNFESIDERLFISGDSVLPLIRYEIGDHGGVYTYKDIESKLKQSGYSVYTESVKVGILNKISQLPFVYVYEREDLSTTIYGVQIYPDYIKSIFFQEEFLSFFTGKFALETVYDEKQNQSLVVNMELKKDIDVNTALNMRSKMQKDIINTLVVKSSEFSELHDKLGNKVNPTIVFREYSDIHYFQPGIKQKWSI